MENTDGVEMRAGKPWQIREGLIAKGLNMTEQIIGQCFFVQPKPLSLLRDPSK